MARYLLESSTVDSYSTGGTTGNLSVSSTNAVGQTFFVPSSTTLLSASFLVDRIGAPTGTSTAVIYALTGTPGTDAFPTGSPLATSDGITDSTIPTAIGTVTWNFSGANQISLAAGTWYGAALVSTSVNSGTDIVRAYRDISGSASHAGNAFTRASNGLWGSSGAAFDFIFGVNGSNATDTYLLEDGTSHYLQEQEYPLVQTKSATKTATGTTLAIPLTSNIVTGDVGYVQISNDSATVGSVTAVTDTAGNTYTKQLDLNEGTSPIANMSVWVNTNLTGGTAPTINITLGGAYVTGAQFREHGGFAGLGSVDVKTSAASSVAGTAPNSGTTGTTASAVELIVGFGSTGDSGNTYTAGSGFGGVIALKVGTTLDMGTEYKETSATGTQSATFTISNSSNWAAGVIAFKASSGGSPPASTTNWFLFF